MAFDILSATADHEPLVKDSISHFTCRNYEINSALRSTSLVHQIRVSIIILKPSLICLIGVGRSLISSTPIYRIWKDPGLYCECVTIQDFLLALELENLSQ
ncbi:hypothetical protein GcM1_190017 [Golovinomyces cichoracearum]|uniref:Uncharacterized protein n=1 Tax=Golovinomyces cichoracearum TaxID=62708 RepID=A0A420J1P3_9PEZI|nr:hypothetical protein GcM1_190017 [Golovinomyces cichoracearum]